MKQTVVLYPGFGVGHVVPMAELAKVFLSHGYDFTMVIVPPPSAMGANNQVEQSAAANPSISFHVFSQPPFLSHKPAKLFSAQQINKQPSPPPSLFSLRRVGPACHSFSPTCSLSLSLTRAQVRLLHAPPPSTCAPRKDSLSRPIYEPTCLLQLPSPTTSNPSSRLPNSRRVGTLARRRHHLSARSSPKLGKERLRRLTGVVEPPWLVASCLLWPSFALDPLNEIPSSPACSRAKNRSKPWLLASESYDSGESAAARRHEPESLDPNPTAQIERASSQPNAHRSAMAILQKSP
ncbi:hypothetical protein HU200_012037 [Digitaria exilis]|uniref:Uncharacterized protein n=1 Tax=Digitaria exilis TaxID=1010633 RepID=A0A835FGX8_9POAL|nr:hypothetical protein HU200_012037 [Digitaria exilis]